MSPAIKYTLGRLGVFVVVLAILLPVPLNFLVKAMIALVASAAFAYFLLAKWRNEMAEQLGSVQQRRQAEKNRLRAALAGDEAAAAAGDRAPPTGNDAAGNDAAGDRTPAGDDATGHRPPAGDDAAGDRTPAGDDVAAAAGDRAAEPAREDKK